MNADAFRHLYEYHFSENRALWDNLIMPLSQEQFTQSVPYSLGSIHHHIVHLMSVDNSWFGDLRGDSPSDFIHPDTLHNREAIRAFGDEVERKMRDYLATLTDDMLFQKPLSGEDEALFLWQVLIHVMNHGTDHRAQMLRIIHDMGQQTPPQDYVFYVYDHPQG